MHQPLSSVCRSLRRCIPYHPEISLAFELPLFDSVTFAQLWYQSKTFGKKEWQGWFPISMPNLIDSTKKGAGSIRATRKRLVDCGLMREYRYGQFIFGKCNISLLRIRLDDLTDEDRARVLEDFDELAASVPSEEVEAALIEHSFASLSSKSLPPFLRRELERAKSTEHTFSRERKEKREKEQERDPLRESPDVAANADVAGGQGPKPSVREGASLSDDPFFDLLSQVDASPAKRAEPAKPFGAEETGRRLAEPLEALSTEEAYLRAMEAQGRAKARLDGCKAEREAFTSSRLPASRQKPGRDRDDLPLRRGGRSEPAPLIPDHEWTFAEIRDGKLDGLHKTRGIPANAVRALFSHWQSLWSGQRHKTATARDKRAINRARNEGWKLSDFAKAIEGMTFDSWPDRKLYCSFEHVAKSMDKWVFLYNEHGGAIRKAESERKPDAPAIGRTKRVKGVIVPADYEWTEADDSAVAMGLEFCLTSNGWKSKKKKR